MALGQHLDAASDLNAARAMAPDEPLLAVDFKTLSECDCE